VVEGEQVELQQPIAMVNSQSMLRHPAKFYFRAEGARKAAKFNLILLE
jgi:hypothetical protein